jgi:hypothetical protein
MNELGREIPSLLYYWALVASHTSAPGILFSNFLRSHFTALQFFDISTYKITYHKIIDASIIKKPFSGLLVR